MLENVVTILLEVAFILATAAALLRWYASTHVLEYSRSPQGLVIAAVMTLLMSIVYLAALLSGMPVSDRNMLTEILAILLCVGLIHQSCEPVVASLRHIKGRVTRWVERLS